MKRLKVYIASFCLPLAAMAATDAKIEYLPEMYAIRISPDGALFASRTGVTSAYDINSGETFSYSDAFVGTGNSVANNGMIVGAGDQGAAIFLQGETIYPSTMQEYGYAQFNGVTKDATRVVGMMGNSEMGPTYIPFVADIDESGQISNLVTLPFPDRDLFRSIPQWVGASWISEDGKTILGEVLDGVGYYSYPIIFTEDSNGEWNYTLPSASLFNPEGIEIPMNPYVDEPDYPYPENFMSGAALQAYREAKQAFAAGQGLNPDEFDYMTDEQAEAYMEALKAYNDWFYSDYDKIAAYFAAYDAVQATSPTFALSEFCIHPDGKSFMTRGGLVQSDGKLDGKIYEFSTTGLVRIIDTPNPDLYPSQILSDGTLVATLPKMAVPNTYLLLSGAEDFITIREFLEPEYPELSNWMDETIPYGSGLVCVSDDMSVMAGGLLSDQLADYGEKNDYYYSSYVFYNLAPASVENLSLSPFDGSYKVYNLQGVKMLETKEIKEISNLPKGIYIINGKKIVL